MTRNEAAYTGEVGSMQFSHFLQIYGKVRVKRAELEVVEYKYLMDK